MSLPHMSLPRAPTTGLAASSLMQQRLAASDGRPQTCGSPTWAP